MAEEKKGLSFEEFMEKMYGVTEPPKKHTQEEWEIFLKQLSERHSQKQQNGQEDT